MALNVFDENRVYLVKLWGHAFNLFPQADESPRLPGRFAADTVELPPAQAELCGDKEFAVFTVDLPKGNDYPASWAGRYMIPMGRLRGCRLEEV